MKKYLSFGVLAIAFSAMFSGCSKTSDFSDVIEENNAQIAENLKNEYRLNFEKKYGKVDANQTWDFTGIGNGTTRAEAVTCVNIDYPGTLQTSLHTDKSALQKILVNGETVEGAEVNVKTWNPNVSVNMYPAFSNDEANKNVYFRLAATYNNVESTFSTVQIKNNAWWKNNGATAPCKEAKGINTTGLENVSWSLLLLNNKKVEIGRKTISTFKEVKVNNRTYWCFNYNGTKYTDLIFLVAERPIPTAKRYLIEDLGSRSDFDFNDIVVDVMQDDNGDQKAIIRAMGGTIDFAMQIGNTTWTKSAKFPNYQEMLNTGWQGSAISYGAELDKFEVSGYDPSINNISVTVQGRGGSEDVMVITFPKKGKAPMIIALDASNNWMDERSSVPTGWFTTE